MFDYAEEFHSDGDIKIALSPGRSTGSNYSSDEDDDHDVGYLDIREVESVSPFTESERRTSSSGYSSHYLDSNTRSLSGSGTKTTHLVSDGGSSLRSEDGDSPRYDGGSGRRGILRNKVSFSPVIDARFECMSTENTATQDEKVNDLLLRPPVYIPLLEPEEDEDLEVECGYDSDLPIHLQFTDSGSECSGTMVAEKEETTGGGKRGPDSAERLLNRRQFHKSNFVRYRYPAQFHQDKNKNTGPKSVKLPTSLQPAMRYGKEPRVQKDRGKRKVKTVWPEPPRYPPKARHTEVQCEIIKLVETMEIATQATPEITETSSQAVPITRETGIQYPRVKRKDSGIQTKHKKTKDQAIQNVSTTTNKMVETSTRILYFPEINTQHNWSQTENNYCCSCGGTISTGSPSSPGGLETINSTNSSEDAKPKPMLTRSKKTVESEEDEEDDDDFTPHSVSSAHVSETVNVAFKPQVISSNVLEVAVETTLSDSDVDSSRGYDAHGDSESYSSDSD